MNQNEQNFKISFTELLFVSYCNTNFICSTVTKIVLIIQENKNNSINRVNVFYVKDAFLLLLLPVV